MLTSLFLMPRDIETINANLDTQDLSKGCTNKCLFFKSQSSGLTIHHRGAYDMQHTTVVIYHLTYYIQLTNLNLNKLWFLSAYDGVRNSSGRPNYRLKLTVTIVQWCWWRHDENGFMLVAIFWCWRQNFQLKSISTQIQIVWSARPLFNHGPVDDRPKT